ncbi:MAG: hypothetical protein AAGK23_09545 [Pseudomonadota bacterium]
MTYLKLATSLVGATLVSGALVAFAGSPTETFAAMDVDADGLVSEAEFVAYATTNGGHTSSEASAKFSEMAGTDGALTLAELEAASLSDDSSYNGSSGSSS